jgi:hypothetical protein
MFDTIVHDIPKEVMKDRFRSVLSNSTDVGDITEEVLDRMYKYLCQHSRHVCQQGVNMKWRDGLTPGQILFFYGLTRTPKDQFHRILKKVDEYSIEDSWDSCELEFYYLMHLSTIPILEAEGWVSSYQPTNDSYKGEDVMRWSQNIEQFRYNRIHHDFY